ncbi:MAG: MBL fold metallo-hydrolase [Chloroflexota bacterium]|nr:MAG: MBL fold metallo-hydrolase [Chloroflexota bacterium]
MQIKLTFLGAAQTVTGSCYLVETSNSRFLVDCGLYQEREFKTRNWEPFPIPPNTLDFVLITHAHLDHCGLLPKLVSEGFRGPIYCLAATTEITEIMLLDSAKIQQEDAKFKKKRHRRERRKGPYPEIPLYTIDDAKASFPLFSPVKYGETVTIGKGIEATFHDAGHVLGSSMIKVKIRQNGEDRTILFSGDIGRRNKPILRDPTLFEEADYVISESTYGDRLLEPLEDAANEVADVINATVKSRGNIVIPSFALERSQELLYCLNKFLIENRIPHLMVFVDSPMAVRITDVFKHHPDLFDKEMVKIMRQKKSPFDFRGLHLVRTVAESKAINRIKGTVIIIAGSGMCTGGRIKHHLITNISRKGSTILFVGYQASGTLGREIVNGAEKVRILGKHYPVKARVVQINGFSAHADRAGLLNWLSSLRKPPRHLFVTHGELSVSQHFARLVREKTGWEKISVPEYREEFLLD